SAARMPPAAPTPTITTSVFSVAMVSALHALGPRLQADDRFAGERLFARQIVGRELRLRAGETDQTPTGAVLVAAVARVGEHAFDGVLMHDVEERLRGRPHEERRLALLQRRDGFVLLRRREAAERLAVSLRAMGVELDEPGAIKILLVRIRAGE